MKKESISCSYISVESVKAIINSKLMKKQKLKNKSQNTCKVGDEDVN